MVSRAARNAKRREEPVDESRDPAKQFHYDPDPRAHAKVTDEGAYVLTTEGCSCPGPTMTASDCPVHGDD